MKNFPIFKVEKKKKRQIFHFYLPFPFPVHSYVFSAPQQAPLPGFQYHEALLATHGSRIPNNEGKHWSCSSWRGLLLSRDAEGKELGLIFLAYWALFCYSMTGDDSFFSLFIWKRLYHLASKFFTLTPSLFPLKWLTFFLPYKGSMSLYLSYRMSILSIFFLVFIVIVYIWERMVGGNRDHFTEEYYTVQVSLLNIKEPDNENIPKKVMQFSVHLFHLMWIAV